MQIGYSYHRQNFNTMYLLKVNKR